MMKFCCIVTLALMLFSACGEESPVNDDGQDSEEQIADAANQNGQDQVIDEISHDDQDQLVEENDQENQDPPDEGNGQDIQDQTVAEINTVLMDRLKRGYETEDLELYMSSFWEDGYFYWADMGSDDDVADDVIFEHWEQERDSAIAVFENYRNIELEVSEPPEVNILNEGGTKAEVKNHHKIRLYVPAGASLPGGYQSYCAEGDNIFLFDLKDNGNGQQEWRIAEWRQNEYSEEEIDRDWSTGSLDTTWGMIKAR